MPASYTLDVGSRLPLSRCELMIPSTVSQRGSLRSGKIFVKTAYSLLILRLQRTLMTHCPLRPTTMAPMMWACTSLTSLTSSSLTLLLTAMLARGQPACILCSAPSPCSLPPLAKRRAVLTQVLNVWHSQLSSPCPRREKSSTSGWARPLLSKCYFSVHYIIEFI